jgi:hypothetical protein
MVDTRQRLGKHIPMATNIYATIELFGAVFSMWPNGTSHGWLVRVLSLRIFITLSLIYTLYKSLQHTAQSVMSSLVIAG